MIAPTVGKAVTFHPQGKTSQPLHAVIVKVNTPQSVNLAMWQPDGVPVMQPHTDIPLYQTGDALPTDGSRYAVMPAA